MRGRNGMRGNGPGCRVGVIANLQFGQPRVGLARTQWSETFHRICASGGTRLTRPTHDHASISNAKLHAERDEVIDAPRSLVFPCQSGGTERPDVLLLEVQQWPTCDH